MDPNIAGTPFLILILYIWSVVAKGIALYRAASLKQVNWFVAILIFNTAGVLEVLYLFRFAKKNLTFEEIQSWPSSLRIWIKDNFRI